MQTKLKDKPAFLQFGIILSVFLCVIVGTYFLLVDTIVEQQDDAPFVNGITMQRLLVERYARYASMSINRKVNNNDLYTLKQIASLIENNYTSIIKGGDVKLVEYDGKKYHVAPISDEGIKQSLTEAYSAWFDMKIEADLIISGSSKQVNIRDFDEKVNHTMWLQNEAVRVMQKDIEENKINLLKTLKITIVLCFTAFILLLVYSYYGITKPIRSTITKLEHERKEHEGSKNFLREMIDAITEPIFVKNAKHQWVNGNQAFWKLMGGDESLFVGKDDYDIFPPHQAEIFWAKDEYVIKNKLVDINEEKITKTSGETIIAVTKKVPLILPDGSDGLVGIINDITHIKLAERKLISVNNKLQELINNAPNIIYIKDESGKYVMVNEAYEKLFNLQKKQIIDQTDYDLFTAKIAKQFVEADRIVFTKLKRVEFEETAPTAEGLRVFKSIKFPVYDEVEKCYYLYGISTDITHVKKLEQELKEANAKLEKQTATKPA